MNYDFLRTYNVPLRTRESTKQYHSHRDDDYGMASGYGVMVSPQPPPPPHAPTTPAVVLTGYEYEQNPYAYYDSNNYVNCATSEADSMHGIYYSDSRNRYVSSGKQESTCDSYVTYHNKPHKRKYSGSTIERVTETSADGTLVIFQGRHISYPNELNQLIHPLSCEVCQVKMNSMLSAKDHYESKVHDRHLTMWLKKNYTDKGLEAPPVKRFLKQGSAGPEAYYCESCDLHLTSLSHATQHYSGRKHRSVISKMAKPSGPGYYDSQGKWVRYGSVRPAKDSRFGIGEQFKQYINQTSIENKTSAVMASTSSYDTTATSTQSIIMKPAKADHLYCPLCNVNVTSAIQMAMHLNGVKHKKKIQQKESGEDDNGSSATATATATAVAASAINNSINNSHSTGNCSTTTISAAAALSKATILSTVLQADSTTPTTTAGVINLNDMAMYRTPSGQYYCKVCNITMTNVVSLQQHLTGKRHVKSQMEKRAKAAITNYALNM